MNDCPQSTDRGAIDWLVALIIGGALVVLGVAVAGLFAALVGWMVPVTVAGIGIVVIGLLVYLFVAGAHPIQIRWKVSAPVLLAGGVIAVFAVAGARFAAEHLLTDRDPGVYVTTARWLASHGTLLVEGAAGAFANVPGIDGVSQGHYGGRTDGLIYTQFQHGLAVLMAVGHWIGGDWLLLKSVALLSGGALATFYAFARIVLRPWWALAATTGVAVNLVVVHFGRDAYSESLLMIFLFSGLWLLNRALRSGRWTGSLLAGLMMGGTALVRIDAWLGLAGIAAFLFVDVWTAGHQWQKRVRSVAVPVAVGIVITGGLGIVDLLVASPEYLRDLMPNVYRISGVMFAVVSVGLLVSITARPWNRLDGAGADRWRSYLGNGVAIFIAGGAAFLFFIRPVLFVERSGAMVDVIEYYQRLQGLPLDGTRRYWEMSMHWLSWYIGVGGLIVGVAGWAWTAREAFLGRMKRMAPFLLAFSIVTVAFLWRPANTPDHLWMMRRFLSLTIPGFVFLSFVVVQRLVLAVKDRWGTIAAAATTGGLTALLLIPPAVFTAPLARSTTQVGMYGVTREVCASVGDDAAVLVVSNRIRVAYEPALRAFCDLPVSGITEPPTLETLETLADAWSDEGRTLYVASLPNEGCEIAPVLSTFIWYPSPERTLTRRPAAEVDSRFGIALYSAADFVDSGSEAWSRCIDLR
ncbi:MAG: hypothetical protein U9R51_02560 [Actinomycetota bacterium]|nr:hypothetical protein [Actinomycetota bacterium]